MSGNPTFQERILDEGGFVLIATLFVLFMIFMRFGLVTL